MNWHGGLVSRMRRVAGHALHAVGRREIASRGVLAGVFLALALPAFAAGTEKRGIGLTIREPHYQQIACLAEGFWYYNWSPAPLNISYNLHFVPMVRGSNDLDSVLRSPPSHQYDTLLMFNEPNKSPRAKNYNASLKATTDELDRYTAELAPYAKMLVGPSPVRAFRPWFGQYMSSGEANRYLGAVAIHWYGPADFGAFKSYIDRTASAYHKPIWLTEFAVIDKGGTFAPSDVVKFLDQALPYLDSDPMVQRYAWFGLRGNNSRPYKDSGFFDAGGRLTVVGDRYLLSPLSLPERASRLARCGVAPVR